MKLSDLCNRKSHNLHTMRFLAAAIVIISHAFPLVTGAIDNEPLYMLSDGQLTLGGFAVSVFFLCGGFLITKSVERLQTFKSFFLNRIIRIIPPLIFVVFLSVVFGMFLTDCSMLKYIASMDTWKYLLNGVLILTHDLPGVFSENPYTSTVNGSLWTLPLEFLCYVACFFIYKIGFTEKKRFLITVPIAIVFFLGVYLVSGRFAILAEAIRPCLLFYIGIAFWVYREHIMLKRGYAILFFVILILSIILKLANFGMIMCFPYIMFYIWFASRQCSDKISRFGDYSYGIYLWGYPIQQFLVTLIFVNNTEKQSNLLWMSIFILLSILLSFLFGVCTYLITEKGLQNYLKNKSMKKEIL